MTEETENSVLVTENKVNASVLDAFDLLKAPNDSIKVNGGAKIIFQLQGSENEKELQYVLKRLVRSLGANVPDIRTGYFATLVTILANFTQINVNQLLELIKKELHANGSSKSEVGDVALGQILVCGAIFRSGQWLKCSAEEQCKVIQLLLAASKKKSYLSTVAHLILLDFVNGLDEEQFATIVWPLLKQDLKKDVKEHTLDSLYFLMVVSKKFPNKVKLRKLTGNPEILCEDNIHSLCEKIMTGIDFNSCSHPIYKEIGINIANMETLGVFWTSGIDSQLVKHNRNRELVAVNLLTTILSNIHDNFNVIPDLLSKNFFKLFMDWFKGLQTASKVRSKRDDEDDNKIMIKKQKELLNALAKALKSDKVDNKVRVEVLKKLLFNPGEINFTEITGTTIVKSIIADLNKDGVKKVAKLLKGVLLNTTKKIVKEDVERNWYNNERMRASELLSYLVSHEAVKDDTEFKLAYMKILMCLGFFKIGGDDNIAVSNDLSGSIKSCFYRCFTSRFSNVDSLVTVLSSLCSFICDVLNKEEVRTKIEKQFPKENMECWEMLIDICSKIENKKFKSKVDNVFLILLYQLGLFLFSEPIHVKLARSSIKELKSCYEHYSKDNKKKTKVKQANINDEPQWIEVMVEVLLSILSAESSVLRSVVQCVFRLLWEYLTPSTIEQIVSVLDPESESNPLTQEDESEDEGEEDAALDKEDEDDSSDKSDEDDSEIDDDNDEDMKTPDQLRLAVQKALGAAVPDTDTESVDADMIDEEEGKKLDEALAEAFKQFHQGKGKKLKKDRKDKKALSDFRIRVLDLIDIYLEKDPSMDICLGMIAPLVRCLEFCVRDNQFNELEKRVRKTIKTLTKVRKFSSIDDVTVNVLCEHLKVTIDKGSRSLFLFQVLGDVITQVATFIIACSLKLEGRNAKTKNDKSESLLEILKESMQNYFLSRNSILPIIFFHNILQMEWDGSYELVQIVAENIFNNDVRQFRRNEGVELLAGFYRSLNRRRPTSEEAIRNLSNLESHFNDTVRKNLEDNNDFSAKHNFFVIIKKLLNTMEQFHKHCNIESNLDFKSLVDIVGSCKSIAKANNNKQNSQNVSQSNGKKSKKIKKKRKLIQINGQVEPKKKKAKKISNSE